MTPTVKDRDAKLLAIIDRTLEVHETAGRRDVPIHVWADTVYVLKGRLDAAGRYRGHLVIAFSETKEQRRIRRKLQKDAQE